MICRFILTKLLCTRVYNITPPSALETRQEKSFEVSIPVLEHDKLHFGSGRVSVLNIMIKIAFSPRASLGLR